MAFASNSTVEVRFNFFIACTEDRNRILFCINECETDAPAGEEDFYSPCQVVLDLSVGKVSIPGRGQPILCTMITFQSTTKYDATPKARLRFGSRHTSTSNTELCWVRPSRNRYPRTVGTIEEFSAGISGDANFITFTTFITFSSFTVYCTGPSFSSLQPAFLIPSG